MRPTAAVSSRVQMILIAPRWTCRRASQPNKNRTSSTGTAVSTGSLAWIVGTAIAAAEPDLGELDLNPVFVGYAGQGAVAADALVLRR